MIFDHDIRLNNGAAIENARLKAGALPASGVVGQVHTDGGNLFYHNGDTWQQVAKATDVEHVGNSEFYVSPAWEKGANGDRFFTSIQDAVDAALSEDVLNPTVYLLPGLYSESVTIDNALSFGGEKTLHIQGIGRVVWSTPMNVLNCLNIVTTSSILPLSVSLSHLTLSTGPTALFISNTLLAALPVFCSYCQFTSTATVADSHGIRIEGLCALRLNDCECTSRAFAAGTGGLSYTAVSPTPTAFYARNCIFRSTNSGLPIRSNAGGNWLGATLGCYSNIASGANIVFTVETPVVNANV